MHRFIWGGMVGGRWHVGHSRRGFLARLHLRRYAAAMSYAPLVTSLLALAFLVSIGWVIATAQLSARGARRRFPSSWKPVFVVPWRSGAGELADAIVAAVPNTARAPWALERTSGPEVALHASVMMPDLRRGVASVRVRRDGKTRAIIEVRSAHPLLRPRSSRGLRVVALVDEALRVVVVGGEIERQG